MKGKKKNLKADLAKFDKYQLKAKDYDDAPELTDEWFAAANLYKGDKLIKLGRPKKENKAIAISIRLDADIVNAFRQTGRGWHTKINHSLKQFIAEHPL